MTTLLPQPNSDMQGRNASLLIYSERKTWPETVSSLRKTHDSSEGFLVNIESELDVLEGQSCQAE